MMKGYKYQSEFAKKYVEQGRIEGRNEVLNEERVEEAVRALLIVLQARSITLPEPTREKILAEKDLERLRRWVEKAAVAPSIAEVLDDPS